MVDGDVFRMSEAVDAAELAAARVARKQTNKSRAAEELAMSAATLPLSSNMLLMLLLLNKMRWLLLRRKLPSQPDKQRSCSHLRIKMPIPTKMRATTTVLTAMMTQLN